VISEHGSLKRGIQEEDWVVYTHESNDSDETERLE
jgi:hypothetical protein